MSQVRHRTRIQDIDALRGFALLGIVIVNITFAASGFPIHVAEDPAYQGMRRVKDRTALIVAVAIYAYLFVTLTAAAMFVATSSIIDPTTAVAAAQETAANLARLLQRHPR